MLPFRVGQVARVTQLVTVVERAVFGGPHSGSRGCSPTGTHRGVEPVKRISPPAVNDSNDSQRLRTDTYRGRSVDIKQVGRELGVRYVVEGSVRRDVGRVRVSSQLIDATNGQHLWAERYDRALEGVFAVQDEITGAVVSAIRPAVSDAEI